MKKAFIASIAVLAVCSFLSAGFAQENGKGKSGEELFKEHCSVCHPDGGNIINPQFTLHKKDREAHGVKKAADIIGKMRKPGPGMTQFDKNAISDEDSIKIAAYILRTFK
jgi:cytochrome c6